ncbi:MAG: membrane dipeptidase [Ruminococcaceae bacterium]|nr:membrane dipeptidase [Oscillospiraceae bacterium]
MTIPLFDSHSDTVHMACAAGKPLRENDMHLDLVRSAAFSPRGQVFSIWGNPKTDPPMFAPVMAYFERELSENSDLIVLCRSAEDIRSAQAAGKCAAIVSIEGAEQIECSIERLREAHERGVSVIHICWNHDNALTGSATEGQGGLTEAGRRFVEEVFALGMIPDLSHISERAFWEILDMSDRPVLAGHSDAASVCAHPRNLTDDQFRALARRGGVAGLNLSPRFLGRGQDVEAVVDHAEHFLSLGGEKAVGLGTDLDGVTQLPDGLHGIEDFGVIYEAMLRRNWSEELVHDIFFHNLNNFFMNAL